jgi:hypothetical protein
VQISRMIGFWLVLILFVGAGIFAVWRLRKRRLLAASLAVASTVLALGAGAGTWAWATAPALPGLIDYDAEQWYSEWSPQPLSPRNCVLLSALQRSGAWPLQRVGRITWVSWGSEGSVGRSGRGYPVYTHLPSEIFVEVRPGCYSAYTAV